MAVHRNGPGTRLELVRGAALSSSSTLLHPPPPAPRCRSKL